MVCRLFSTRNFAIFLQLIATFTVGFPSFSPAAELAIANQFVGKVRAFKEVVMEERGKWLSPQSPWFAYSNRQFEEGLSSTQKMQYLALQTKGRCVALLKLEITGFIGLYPELSEALSDKIVTNIFFNKIIPAHSYGFRRCQAHAMLIPIIEEEKKLDPEFYYLSIPGTNLGNKLENIFDPRQLALRKAFKTLFDLAACYDYDPAINDILAYYKLFLIFVGHNERYYFYTRAKHYGLEAPDIRTVTEEMLQYWSPNPYPQADPANKLYAQYSPVRKLKTILQLLARGDLDAARKTVFYRTYISCGRGDSE